MTEFTKDEVNLLGKLLLNFGGSSREVEVKPKGKLVKKFYPDTLQTVEPIYVAGDEVDGHGEGYEDPVEGPRKLVKSLEEGQKKGTLQYSLFHKYVTNTFEIEKMWVNEKERVLEDGTVVAANLPLALVKWNNEKAYNARVEGRLTGLSIGALGVVEAVGEEVYKGFLELLNSSAKKVRVIKEFIFTHKAAHIAFTSPSQGGAASLRNEYYQPEMLMKSKILPDLEQEALLDEFGELEELRELAKAKLKAETLDSKAPSTSATAEALDAGVDNQNLNKGQDEMSEDLQKAMKQIEELQKQLATKDMKEAVAKYSLKDEEASSLASALVELKEDGRTAVLKSLDSIKAKAEAKEKELADKVEALETEKVDLAKALESKESQSGENPILKALEGEQGEAAPVEQKAPQTLAERVAAKRQAKSQ